MSYWGKLMPILNHVMNLLETIDFFLEGGAEREAQRGANRQMSSNSEREGERQPDATDKAVITHPNLTPTGTHTFCHNYSKVWQKLGECADIRAIASAAPRLSCDPVPLMSTSSCLRWH